MRRGGNGKKIRQREGIKKGWRKERCEHGDGAVSRISYSAARVLRVESPYIQ